MQIWKYKAGFFSNPYDEGDLCTNYERKGIFTTYKKTSKKQARRAIKKVLKKTLRSYTHLVHLKVKRVQHLK